MPNYLYLIFKITKKFFGFLILFFTFDKILTINPQKSMKNQNRNTFN